MKEINIRCFLVFCIFLIGSKYIAAQGLQLNYVLTPQLNSMGGGNSNNNYNNEVSRNNNQTFTAYTGLGVAYFFTSRLGIGTRINIGKDAQLFIYQNKQNGNVMERSKHHYRFTMLKIPLQVKFKANAGKMRFFVEGGPQICYLLKATNKGDYGKLDYTNDYAALNFGFQVATGIGVQLSEHVACLLMPNIDITALSFNYTKENLNQNFPLGRNITSSDIGLQIGLIWSR